MALVEGCGEGGIGERDSTSDKESSESLSLFMVSAAACTRGEGRGETCEGSGERSMGCEG